MEDYSKLWKFVGRESGLDKGEIYKETKIKVQFLSMQEMVCRVKKDTELLIRKNAKAHQISKSAFLKLLKEKLPNLYLIWEKPEEANGKCYVIPFLKKQGCNLKEIDFIPVEDYSNYDVLIYINEGNIEKRRQEWSKKNSCILTTKEVELFLIIHEMIHAYERLNEYTGVHPEQEDYDMLSSQILHKWTSNNTSNGCQGCSFLNSNSSFCRRLKKKVNIKNSCKFKT